MISYEYLNWRYRVQFRRATERTLKWGFMIGYGGNRYRYDLARDCFIIGHEDRLHIIVRRDSTHEVIGIEPLVKYLGTSDNNLLYYVTGRQLSRPRQGTRANWLQTWDCQFITGDFKIVKGKTVHRPGPLRILKTHKPRMKRYRAAAKDVKLLEVFRENQNQRDILVKKLGLDPAAVKQNSWQWNYRMTDVSKPEKWFAEALGLLTWQHV